LSHQFQKINKKAFEQTSPFSLLKQHAMHAWSPKACWEIIHLGSLYKQFQQILNLLCFSDQELSRCKKACNNQGYRHPWRTCTIYFTFIWVQYGLF